MELPLFNGLNLKKIKKQFLSTETLFLGLNSTTGYA